ncbi:MAG: thioesterase family protein [Actinobacteria bacterium]|nr:thioesterase family protein [Actinomycetota bacterium]
MTEALFYEERGRYVPTDLTRSPWDPSHQHGGPPLALVVRAAERALPEGLQVWRVAGDILRPIPHSPLTVEVTVNRPGRRVTLVDAIVLDDLGPVVLGRVWGIRATDPLGLPDPADPHPEPPPPPEELGPTPFSFAPYTWYGDALDVRLASGALDAPGAAAAWFRLRVPVIDGEQATPVQQIATMIDSGNGISWGLPFGEWLFINSDISMYLLRAPIGEWFALEAVSHYDDSGRGIAEARLFDEGGYIGRSHQALFVDRIGEWGTA